MEQIEMNPVVMSDMGPASKQIIKFKSLKLVLENSVIPNFSESIDLRRKQEQRYLENQDKLTPERKQQLAQYTLDTKTRENDLQELQALADIIEPIAKICDIVMHHTESMIHFESNKNETKALMAHFGEMINELDEFKGNVEKINIFTPEGFKIDGSKLQMKTFKIYIDKLWNYLQMNHGGKSTK